LLGGKRRHYGFEKRTVIVRDAGNKRKRNQVHKRHVDCKENKKALETNGYEKAGVTVRNAKEICNLFIALFLQSAFFIIIVRAFMHFMSVTKVEEKNLNFVTETM
jgi:hypothetical protein